jgi:hypothetical protein
MSSKVFEEAIADAKKLRSVAEENAKKAILEAVTPRIREFIEDQLLEKDSEEDLSEATLTADQKKKVEDEVKKKVGPRFGRVGINPEDAIYMLDDIDFGDILKTSDEAVKAAAKKAAEIAAKAAAEAKAKDSSKGMDEEVVLDENALRSLVDMLGGGDILSSLEEGNDVFNSSLKHAVESLDETEQQKLFALADKINESADKLESKRINNNEKSIQEKDDMKNEKFYEVDLRALRESIEAEMAHMGDEMDEDMYGEGDDVEGEGLEMDEDDELMREIKLMLDLGDDVEEDALPEELRGMLVDDEDEDLDVALEDPEGEEDAEEGDDLELDDDEMLPDLMGGESEEEDLQETFEVNPKMLRQELARARKAIREGKMDHHFGGKGNGKAGVKKSFGGGSEGQDVFVSPPQMNKLNEAIRNLRRTNRSQKEKLTKYRSAVQTLREQLEDLNLFNAKLLYVNKLLQNKALSESQKKSVIKALDEAKSLVETKSLYKSLTESLSQSKKSLNEAARYGSSSRTTTSSSSKNLTEAAGEMSRWQTLAGLK